EIIRLLADYGADLNRPSPADNWLTERVKGLTPIQIAERNSDSRAVQFFLEKGARDNRSPADFLIGACARADSEAAERIVRDNPDVMQSLNPRDLSYFSVFARSGRLDSIRLMANLGFDIEARADDLDATGVTYAASNGDVPMVQLLIQRGAKLDVNQKYGGNPLVTAIY